MFVSFTYIYIFVYNQYLKPKNLFTLNRQIKLFYIFKIAIFVEIFNINI